MHRKWSGRSVRNGSISGTLRRGGYLLLLFTVLRAAGESRLEVGKLWLGPTVTNYGYCGAFEYPGGARDFYIIEQAAFFSAVFQGTERVFYGGALGNELDFGWQNADGRYEPWQKLADGINRQHLSAGGDFSRAADGDPGLEVHTAMRMFNHPDYDDFLVVSHTFTNTASAPVTGFYYGSHLPVDVGASGISYKDLDDYGAHHAASGLTYMYDDDGDDGLTPYLAGQILLSVDTGNGPDTAARWTAAAFYQMVNPIAGAQDLLDRIKGGITLSTGSPGPWSIINAVGPYELAAGAALTFNMAVVFGEGLEGLRANALAARRLAALGFAIPPDRQPPPVPELLEINVASRVIELRWSNFPARTAPDFNRYRIYRSDISTIGPWTLAAETTDTLLIDIGRSGFPLYYTLTSTDLSGNETGPWGRAGRTLEAVRPLGKAVADLQDVLVVPNPYLGGADWESFDYENRLYFTRLPRECTIHVYTLLGDLVASLAHNLPGDLTWDFSGDEAWDLLSGNRQTIASGLYLFRVVTPAGEEVQGKFMVVKGRR